MKFPVLLICLSTCSLTSGILPRSGNGPLSSRQGSPARGRSRSPHARSGTDSSLDGAPRREPRQWRPKSSRSASPPSSSKARIKAVVNGSARLAMETPEGRHQELIPHSGSGQYQTRIASSRQWVKADIEHHGTTPEIPNASFMTASGATAKMLPSPGNHDYGLSSMRRVDPNTRQRLKVKTPDSNKIAELKGQELSGDMIGGGGRIYAKAKMTSKKDFMPPEGNGNEDT